MNSVAPWNGPQLLKARNQLTIEQLRAQKILPLLDMSFFSQPEWSEKASDNFSGTLSFTDTTMTYPKEKESYSGEDLFPAFSTRFITHNGELIPVEQGLIRTDKNSESMWDVIIGVGKVWHETNDDEWNRASFPLSLTDRFIGQVRNCVASFAYKEQVTSNIYVQCSQETADANDGRLGNIQVMLSADFQANTFPEEANIIKKHNANKQNRLPVQPLLDIDSNNELTTLFNKTLMTNASTSLGAVLKNNTIYLHPPNTRHGIYPYPNEMRHGLYSVTKSMAGALSMFYFAKRYGNDIFDELITDYVPELKSHPGWQGVTFSHTLNMVSGTEGGEGPEQLLNTIIVAETANESIENIAKLGDAPEAPGKKFNYASTNYFVLSYALQNYVEKREGKDTKYWELVKENVLSPIGAESFIVQHTQEKDGSLGIPFLAYGATPTIDEAAKITALISNEGEYEGQQLLSKQRVQEALGRTSWKGYHTNNDWRGQTYRHGFWASSVLSNSCEVSVTYMLGFGGNYILLLPSGSVLFRFMDEFDFNYEAFVQSIEKSVPSCN